MRKTIHYRDGCPWADGELQMSDTRQTTNWKEVTCKHCLRSRTQRAADGAYVRVIYIREVATRLILDPYIHTPRR